jgi:hypothetical protein
VERGEPLLRALAGMVVRPLPRVGVLKCHDLILLPCVLEIQIADLILHLNNAYKADAEHSA